MEATDQIAQECLAVRKNCVLFDHPNRGVIEVRGQDRIQFLHNVLSNDIKSLSPGNGAPACLLNAQAKIIANMNVLCFDEFLWLALDYILKDKLSDALGKLIIMEQVELTDRSDELKLISVHGPKAKELIQNALKEKSILEKLLDHKTFTVDNTSATVIRINLIGEVGYGLLIPKDRTDLVYSALKQSGKPLGLIQIQASTLEVLRIEAGIPRYGIDFDDSHIPLEAGLEKTISFTKGCFPGQEILARLDSRGGVSKKLIGLELKGEIAPKKGDQITKDNNEVGSITSAVFSPTLKRVVAMGYLKKECWAVGSPIVVESQKMRVPARVADLPFYSANP